MKLPATRYHNDDEHIAQDTAQTEKNVHASEEITFKTSQVRCVRPIPRHVFSKREPYFLGEHRLVKESC